MEEFAILLTCYNRKDQTLECLKSLKKNTLFFKIFLVDDGSTDGTAKAVSACYPDVNIITGNGQLYWNRGMHLAWETASKNDFDFYIWINDDIILNGDAFKVILEDYKKVKKESIIVGVFESPEKKITYGGYIKGSTKKILYPNGKPQKCDYFNGNFVLIPGSVFKKVGNLDPIFPHAQGDFDYGLRAKKQGIQSYITSSVIGVCERHDKYPKWCDPRVKFSDRYSAFYGPLGGRPKPTFIFEKRHYGFSTALFHFFTIYLRLFFPSYWIKIKKSKI
jgi:GT2 family glycosyltransferase